MRAFGRRLTPQGRLQKYPKIHVSTGEESSGSGPDSTQGLRPRHRWESNPERPPRNSHGDGPFLRPPERVPEVPVKYPKIHVSTGEESSGSGPDSTQGLRHRQRRERNPERPPRNSHGDWPFLRPPERVPDVPVKYPKIHVSTGEEISGSGPDSTQGLRPRHRRERNPERPPRNSHGDGPFLMPPERVPEGPVRNLFSLHCLDVQAEDRLPPRVHVGQPCGKSYWESLMGKTRGKNIDPLIQVADCVTLLLPLWRKAKRIPEFPVASQEEALSTGKESGTPGSCHHSKSPPDVSVHSRGTCFPCTALTFKPRIDSHHVCTWVSPVGKPRGKASWERHEGKP
ncbi:hypothetical protein MJT46_017419 [Ovis ammon polii x Ovis aries]|nr:hypothetical protein MJT46_017419 [Ovis ammon polii x Ovis aries]